MKPLPRIGMVLALALFGGLANGIATPIDFIAGVDASHLVFFEQRGVGYRANGETRDALEILRDRGVNCVRLRLFTSSAAQAAADPYNAINNLDYTVPLAARIKKAGLRLMLDFHYSDSWADPGKQTKPLAWKALSFAELEQQVLIYSSNCVATFAAAGATPDYVQVGNEIVGGMLWPDGRVGGNYENSVQWSRLGRLLKSAIQGIKLAAPESPPKIVLHIDRGANWPTTQWFFDNVRRQEVDFDIIGQSYYPFWHGDLSSLRRCLRQTADRYGKPVVIAETAFPWTHSTNVVGFPATPAGQSGFVAELAILLKEIPQGLGAGIIWWGTEYRRVDGVRTAGFENRSLFDADGGVLPAVATLGEMSNRPVIETGRSGNQLILTWSLSGAGLSLGATTNLAPTAIWSAAGNDVQRTGNVFRTTLNLDPDPAAFFRLQPPGPTP